MRAFQKFLCQSPILFNINFNGKLVFHMDFFSSLSSYYVDILYDF